MVVVLPSLDRVPSQCGFLCCERLRKRYGEDTHDVCSWIGHSEEVSNSSYMMMFENDYPRAADLGRTAKGNKSGSPSFGGDKMGDTMPSPSLSTQLSDAPQDRLMKGRAQHQPVQGTLLLQELTTLLHSNPVRLGGQISYSLAFQKLPKT